MGKEALIGFFQKANMASSSITEVTDQFQNKVILRNQFLLTEGILSDEYFLLEKGFMRAFAIDTEGNEVTTNFYFENQAVFEVSSFFMRTKSRENIQALTDCEGWVISYAGLNRLFHSLPEFRDFGRSVLVKSFSDLKTRMLSMITETAEERYASLLKTSPEIFRYAPLKNIASFLGITDTSLSRIRKEFSKK